MAANSESELAAYAALKTALQGLSSAGSMRLEQFIEFFGSGNGGEGIDSVLEQIESGESSRSALLIFVIVAGYYPSEQVFRRVETIGNEFGWAATIAWIESCNEISSNEIEFVSGGIAYDVTNTLISPVLTGIQRVVYELGKGIWESEKDIFFFSVRAETGPVLLSSEHEKAFLDKYKPSSGSLTHSEKSFDPYDLLEASAAPKARNRSESLKLAVRARAKSAYEFSKVYVFPPAIALGVASTIARFRAYQQRRREEAVVAKIGREKNDSASRPTLLKRVFGKPERAEKKVAWFEDCNLLVAELFSPMRSDFYPGMLATFKSTTMLIHDVIPITHPQYCVDTVVAAHVGYLRVTSMFDRVVSVSRSTAESYSDFVGSTFETDQQIDPVHLANFLGELPPRTLPDSTRKRVCCFSTMEPRKGHWRVVEACEKLWSQGIEFELVLIGGSGWKSEQLLERIEFLRKEGRPIFRNRRFLDDNEVGMLMRTCLCSIFCSEVEGFGLPVVESLALGVPVICSNVGSMAEIVEMTEGCYPVDPFSIGSIGEAIQRFVDGDLSNQDETNISLAGLRSTEGFVEEVARFPV